MPQLGYFVVSDNVVVERMDYVEEFHSHDGVTENLSYRVDAIEQQRIPAVCRRGDDLKKYIAADKQCMSAANLTFLFPNGKRKEALMANDKGNMFYKEILSQDLGE